MKVYVKDGKTFRNKAIVEAFSWKLVKSIYTDVSELVIESSDEIETNDIIYDNFGWSGVISEITKEDNIMNIKAEDILTLFSRKIIYLSSDMKTTTEQTLMSALATYFQSVSDEEYALPYLSITATTQTARISPVVEAGLWDIKSYISRVRRLQSIYADIYFSATSMSIVIQKKDLLPKTIYIRNRGIEIIEESFSNKSIGKVTAYHSDTDPITSTDYYLLTDGTITTSYTAQNRTDGEWEFLQIGNEQDESAEVRNKFAENSSSHKISFLVPEDRADWDFYDPVLVEVRKRYYSSYIAKKIVHDNGTIEYQCGDLRTTLSDKINKLS